MKAIEINGKIEVFRTIPNSFKVDGKYVAGGGKNLSDEYLKSLGFKDLVEPEYDGIIEKLSNLHLDGDVYTYDVVDLEIEETIDDLKSVLKNELKSKVRSALSQTDWYIIRESDSGEATPQSIKDERAELRALSNAIEADINALTTKKELLLFEINI